MLNITQATRWIPMPIIDEEEPLTPPSPKPLDSPLFQYVKFYSMIHEKHITENFVSTFYLENYAITDNKKITGYVINRVYVSVHSYY